MFVKNFDVVKKIRLLLNGPTTISALDITALGGIRRSTNTLINSVYASPAAPSGNGGYVLICGQGSPSALGSFRCDSPSYHFNLNTNSGYAGTNIVFGNGNTAATYDDYNLETEYAVSSNYTHLGTTVAKALKSDASGVLTTVTSNFTAITDLTIKEIGLAGNINVSGNSYATVLISREVLSTPISVSAGNGFQIVMTIDEPFPSSNEPGGDA